MKITVLNTKWNNKRIETFDDIRFKNSCTETMKKYLYFLYRHHNYSVEKLRETFPEYIENK